jgi:hypothetical protein
MPVPSAQFPLQRDRLVNMAARRVRARDGGGGVAGLTFDIPRSLVRLSSPAWAQAYLHAVRDGTAAAAGHPKLRLSFIPQGVVLPHSHRLITISVHHTLRQSVH